MRILVRYIFVPARYGDILLGWVVDAHGDFVSPRFRLRADPQGKWRIPAFMFADQRSVDEHLAPVINCAEFKQQFPT